LGILYLGVFLFLIGGFCVFLFGGLVVIYFLADEQPKFGTPYQPTTFKTLSNISAISGAGSTIKKIPNLALGLRLPPE
jgi:hypothetical protein